MKRNISIIVLLFVVRAPFFRTKSWFLSSSGSIKTSFDAVNKGMVIDCSGCEIMSKNTKEVTKGNNFRTLHGFWLTKTYMFTGSVASYWLWHV